MECTLVGGSSMLKIKKILRMLNQKRYDNFVKNGDFRDGSSYFNVTSGVVTVENGIFSVDINSVQNVYQDSDEAHDESVKWYISVNIKRSDTGLSSIRLRGTTSGTSSVYLDQRVVNAGEWTKTSGIGNRTQSLTGNTRFVAFTTPTLSEVTVDFKNFIVVNLTELGLEDKSKEWCDEYILPYINY